MLPRERDSATEKEAAEEAGVTAPRRPEHGGARAVSPVATLPVLPVLGIYAGVIAGLYVILRLVSRRHAVLYFAMLFILASFLQLYVFFA